MRVPCLAFIVLLAGVGSVSSAGVEYDAALGRTGIGRCHMDACTLFAIEAATPIAELKDGTMFAFSKLSWETEYKRDDVDEYEKPPISTSAKTPSVHLAYCSKRRPHIFFRFGDGWDVVRVVAAEAPSGAEEYAYALYWASCHHYVGKGRPIEQLATKLGYRFAQAGSTDAPDDDIKTPSDLLRELGTGRR